MKVLMINTVEFNINGISSVILFLCEILKRNNPYINIDVAYFGSLDDYYLERFMKLDINCIELPKRKNVFAYRNFLKRLYKENGYDVIHVHGNSSTMILETSINHSSSQKIITHCHNSKTNHPIINFLLNKSFLKTVDVRLACSQEAGEFLYKNNFEIISNGRFLEEYAFNLDRRKFLREKYGLQNKIVVLNIGNFNQQKNQAFLLNCISELQDKHVFVFVGDYGEKENAVIISKLKQQKNVLIIGKSNDVKSYYSMADLFVLPSLFEGLPLVLIEAQMNGLKCLVSENVTKDCVISDKINFLPLKDSLRQKFISYCLIDDAHEVKFTENSDKFNPAYISKLLSKIYS